MSFQKNNKSNFNPNVNEGIRSPQLRVLFPDNHNEVLQTYIALQKAKSLGLDLIVINPQLNPPVARVCDESKYNYEQKKRQKEAKKKQHVMQVKELKFTPNTDEHDYQFKKNHVVNFLKDGNKVKVNVVFKGREVSHSNLGVDLLNRLIGDVSEFGKPELTPKIDGKSAFILLSPLSHSK